MSEKDYREPLINNIIIFKGVILGIIALIFISIILALTLSLFHSFSMHLFNNILIIFNAALITFVGFYIARHVENNGWLNGGLGGMLLMGIILLIGSINISLSAGTVLLLLILAVALGSAGGIAGINLK